MENVKFFIGIDVSKHTVDIAVLQDGNVVFELRVVNQKKELHSFFKEVKKSVNGFTLDETLVCMEHTGIYNYTVLELLNKMKVKVCVESALHIKKSQGISRGKNDKVDARRIALFAFKNCKELKPWQPKRKSFQKLQALLTLRERLVKVINQLKTPLAESLNFLDKSINKSLQLSTKESLKSLNRDLKRLESEIHDLVKGDEIINKQFELATSVPGVGKITALNMIVTTGEFERISSAKSFACHSGVAPFEYSSGSSVRGRTRVSKLANMGMKKLLHLAALSAIQCNEEIKSYYLRKVSQGKNKMSVLNAVRNKLITRVFVCIKQQRKYEKNFQHSLV
jgi:transposase